jgi:hypothetical protein
MGWLNWSVETWRKLRVLTPDEREVLFRALFMLPVIRVGLHIGGLGRVQESLARLSAGGGTSRSSSGDPLLWGRTAGQMVAVAARHGLVRANCLAQALCLGYLLQRRRLACELRIGVSTAEGSFVAHAWVEQAGQVLNDSADVAERFAPFDTAIDLSRGVVR